MARSNIFLGLLALAALTAAQPARAQLFDSIFGNRPPRPPADVPNAPPSRAEPPYYPSYPDRGYPRQRADEPPDEPQPPPMSLPPQARPGGGAIQSEPLAPVPGTEPKRDVSAPPSGPAAAPPSAALPPPAAPRPGAAPPAPGAAAPPPSEQVVVEPAPQRIGNPTAVFAGLDKITGRIISFDVAINETVQFGALQVTPRVCYSRPPTESPQTDSFVEVDEVTLQGEIKRIYTGWMFAASPGLHAVEHPIYDVWLTECKGGKNPAVAEVAPEAEPAKPPAARPAPPARRQPAPRGALPALR